MKQLLCLTALVLFFVGCNQGTTLKKGDRLLVLEELRENAETQWEGTYTDGFTAIIPKNTILEVVFNPRTGSNVIECIPVEINGKTDKDEVERSFVPSHIFNKDGYKGFVLGLKTDYLGSKLKKID